MNAEQQINQWGQIVTKAWQDDKFKRRLLAEPAAVAKEFGLQVLPGIQLRVVENTDTIVHLTLPAKPRDGEIADSELAGVAGGTKTPSGAASNRALSQWIKAFVDSLTPEGKGTEAGSLSPSQGAGSGPRPA